MKQKDFYDLADAMEKECGDWEKAEGLSEKARSELIARVEAMDREATKKKSNDVMWNRRLRKRYILLLAAVLTLLFGMGVVGERAWITDSEDMERETEITTKVNNEDKKSVLREEEEVYQEIAEKLGIAVPWFGYVPKGMELDSYTIIEDTGWACMNYLYDDKLICVQMAKENAETSSNVQWDGKHRKLEDVKNDYGYEIEAYCTDEEHHNYSASISYGTSYYNLFGVFEDEELFLKILQRIYFKTL